MPWYRTRRRNAIPSVNLVPRPRWGKADVFESVWHGFTIVLGAVLVYLLAREPDPLKTPNPLELIGVIVVSGAIWVWVVNHRS